MPPHTTPPKTNFWRFEFPGLCLLIAAIMFAYQEYQVMVGQSPSWTGGLGWLIVTVSLAVLGIWMWDRTANTHWSIRLILSFVISGAAALLGYGPIRRQYLIEHSSSSRDVADIDDKQFIGLITEWAVIPPNNIRVVLDTEELLPYQKNYKIMVVIRVKDSRIDWLSDPFIQKSNLFSIAGKAQTVISLPLSQIILRHGEQFMGNDLEFEYPEAAGYWRTCSMIVVGSIL